MQVITRTELQRPTSRQVNCGRAASVVSTDSCNFWCSFILLSVLYIYLQDTAAPLTVTVVHPRQPRFSMAAEKEPIRLFLHQTGVAEVRLRTGPKEVPTATEKSANHLIASQVSAEIGCHGSFASWF